MGTFPVDLLVICVIAALLLSFLFYLHYSQKAKNYLEEFKKYNTGDHILSRELSTKSTEFTFEVKGFIQLLGLDAWYCSIANIHNRCASVAFAVNTSVDSSGIPFYPTKKISIICIEGDKTYNNLTTRYIGSFDSRHYFVTSDETI